MRLDLLQDLSEWVADVWNQPIPQHMAGTGKTAFSHAAEVHYALPEGDEWSFNAWAPRVIGNEAYVPLCHYSGPKAIQRKVLDHGLGPHRRRRRAAGPRAGPHRGPAPPARAQRPGVRQDRRGGAASALADRSDEEGTTMGQMDGKNVFLTGASKGMGREIARGLAKEGASIALVARTESALKELAEELAGLGGRGVAIPADVSDRRTGQGRGGRRRARSWTRSTC